MLAAILTFNSAYFSDKNVARFLTLIRIFWYILTLVAGNGACGAPGPSQIACQSQNATAAVGTFCPIPGLYNRLRWALK